MNIEQKIRARMEFDDDRLWEECYPGGHAVWEDYKKAAKWQHEKLVNELAPLLADLSDALDVALRQWYGLSSYTEDTDLEIADNPEAELFREKKAVLKKLEAWLGKNVRREVID
jgi:hypothetical protein